MKRNLANFFVAIGSLLLSGLAFASEGGAESVGGIIAIGSGIAMGLAALGGTMGQGRAAGEALAGIARNPTSSDKVFMPMIISLALIEFQAIMGFIIAILWWNK